MVRIKFEGFFSQIYLFKDLFSKDVFLSNLPFYLLADVKMVE